MVTDPLGDFITRLQNAGRAGHERVRAPYSKLNHEVARILEQEGYVASVEEFGQGVHKTLEVGVRYTKAASPRVREAKRFSRPSRRLYTRAKDIRRHKNGEGHAIISTPLGVLTDKEAREKNVGGEVLFTIW